MADENASFTPDSTDKLRAILVHGLAALDGIENEIGMDVSPIKPTAVETMNVETIQGLLVGVFQCLIRFALSKPRIVDVAAMTLALEDLERACPAEGMSLNQLAASGLVFALAGTIPAGSVISGLAIALTSSLLSRMEDSSTTARARDGIATLLEALMELSL